MKRERRWPLLGTDQETPVEQVVVGACRSCVVLALDDAVAYRRGIGGVAVAASCLAAVVVFVSFLAGTPLASFGAG